MLLVGISIWPLQLGNFQDSSSPFPIKLMEHVRKVEANELCTFCITEDDTLWATGYNEDGSLGIESKENQNGFVKVCDDVKDIKVGSYTLILKNDGSLFLLGREDSKIADFRLIKTNVKEIASTATCCFYLLNDGTLWGFGYNSDDLLCLDNYQYVDPKDAIMLFSNVNHFISRSYRELYFQTGDASIYRAGRGGLKEVNPSIGYVSNNYLLMKDGSVHKIVNMSDIIMTNVLSIACTDMHSLFLKTDGSLYSFGEPITAQQFTFGSFSKFGFIGDGTTEPRLTPIHIMDNIVQIAIGEYTSFAIDNEGTLWGWGLNNMDDMLLYF